MSGKHISSASSSLLRSSMNLSLPGFMSKSFKVPVSVSFSRFFLSASLLNVQQRQISSLSVNDNVTLNISVRPFALSGGMIAIRSSFSTSVLSFVSPSKTVGISLLFFMRKYSRMSSLISPYLKTTVGCTDGSYSNTCPISFSSFLTSIFSKK